MKNVTLNRENDFKILLSAGCGSTCLGRLNWEDLLSKPELPRETGSRLGGGGGDKLTNKKQKTNQIL